MLERMVVSGHREIVEVAPRYFTPRPPAYTRTLLHSFYPDSTPEEIEQRVALKQKRQALIKRKRNPARLDVVLLEAVLHRMVGDPKVMAAQLRHLADLSTLPNVSIRILPLRAGIPLGDPVGLFTIIDFPYDNKGQPVEPSVVYLESLTGSLYLEHAEDIQRYHEAYQAIRHAALDETRSRDLIRRVAKEYIS
ncbi:DUF5753 domain-containing protein [Nocardia thraciensis]